MNTANVYHRSDAVDGVGFLIEHSARPMHSISWPDRLGERMTPDEMVRMGVTCEPIGLGCGQCPVLPPASLVEVLVDVEEAPVEPATTEETDAVAEDTTASDLEAASNEASEPAEGEAMSEAQMIRKYLNENPKATNGDVIKALAEIGVIVTSSQVSRERKKLQSQ